MWSWGWNIYTGKLSCNGFDLIWHSTSIFLNVSIIWPYKYIFIILFELWSVDWRMLCYGGLKLNILSITTDCRSIELTHCAARYESYFCLASVARRVFGFTSYIELHVIISGTLFICCLNNQNVLIPLCKTKDFISFQMHVTNSTCHWHATVSQGTVWNLVITQIYIAISITTF